MRLILFLASALMAGAVGVTQGVIPPLPQMLHAFFATGGDPAQGRPGDANPVAPSNQALPKILRGSSADDVGFHGSAVTIPPGSFHGVNSGAVNAGAIGQSGFASSIVSQIQQNNSRMQDMADFARNPSAWRGTPPH